MVADGGEYEQLMDGLILRLFNYYYIQGESTLGMEAPI